MGNSFAKDINKVFGQGGQGGVAAGGSPEDWPGSNDAGGGPRGTDQRDPDNLGPDPPSVKPPTIPKFVAPTFYSPRQSELQQATYNPSSTSRHYLQQFGASTHF